MPFTVGRYELHLELASGGMAVVHLGRLRGDAGFARAVAIKRLHRQYVGDPELSAFLIDEARLASRLKHPNVISPQDLLTCHGEIFLVMEYVHGLTLAVLAREARARGEPIPIPIAVRLVSDVLSGLHAAHEAQDSQGRPLALVHRDVSPQNVMVGADGLTRVLDFGIAQAAFRSQTTRKGQLRAKLAYAAPEHVLDRAIDRRADVYSTAIVLWEILTLERLFSSSNESALLARVLEAAAQPPSKLRPEVAPELDALLLAALSKEPDKRPATAEHFALALEGIVPPATYREVARWVVSLGGESLERLAARLAEVEAGIAVDETPLTFADSPRTRTSEAPVPPVESKREVAFGSGWSKRRGWKPAAAAMAMAVAVGLAAPQLLSRRLPFAPRASAATVAAAVGDTSPQRPPRETTRPPPPSLDDGPLPVPDAALQLHTIEPPTSDIRKKSLAPASRTVSMPRPLPSDDCAELTELDAQGIRRVKRQCLR